jgi:hypothetical protein
MKPPTTQNAMILEYLESGSPITALEALNRFGCFRLASRIADLRREGHDILSQKVENNGKFYSKYFLFKPYGE